MLMGYDKINLFLKDKIRGEVVFQISKLNLKILLKVSMTVSFILKGDAFI